MLIFVKCDHYLNEFCLLVSGSFAGLGFLAWYLSGKIRVFDRRGHVAKLCISFLPLLAAALVGVSRVDDYWHHWQDVFTGGLIGLFVEDFFFVLCWTVCWGYNTLLLLRENSLSFFLNEFVVQGWLLLRFVTCNSFHPHMT